MATYPVPGDEDIADFLPRLCADGFTAIPSQAVTSKAFAMQGRQPEERLKALRQSHLHLPKGADLDAYLPLIAATSRVSAAEIELARIEQLGGLASAIFDRIATAEGEASGVFTAEAAAPYAASIGREVCVEETRPVLSALMDAGVVMRGGNGRYVVTDPVVQDARRECRALP